MSVMTVEKSVGVPTTAGGVEPAGGSFANTLYFASSQSPTDRPSTPDKAPALEHE
jgi:hypothetical protein